MIKDFHPLRIAEVRRETPDSVSLPFDLPGELADVFAFRAGQHLTVRTEIGGEEVRRNYSVCAAPGEGELRIAIKQIAEGVFSGWANRDLKAGDDAGGHAAARRLHLDVRAGRVAPLCRLRRRLGDHARRFRCSRPRCEIEPKSRFTLFYGNRSTVQVMFLEELAGLKNRFMDRLEVFHFLEDEEEDDRTLQRPPGRGQGRCGALERWSGPRTSTRSSSAGPGR